MSVNPNIIKPETEHIKIDREQTIPPFGDRRSSQIEEPIAVTWSLYGKPSDLIGVKKFAEGLGISIQWINMTKRNRMSVRSDKEMSR